VEVRVEREDPAVTGDQPVPTRRVTRHADDRFVEMDAAQGAPEMRIAKVEDAAIQYPSPSWDEVMLTTAWLSDWPGARVPGTEPRNLASPNENTPPSDATNH
jgi:hypothetical protein